MSISEVIPTVVTVSWTTSSPSRGAVQVSGDGDFETPAATELSTDHSVVVYGLKAGGTYDLRAVSTSEDGEVITSEPETVEIELPPADMPSLTISDYDEEKAAEGGFVLTSLVQPDRSWVVILDRDGDFVWYWAVDDGLSAPGARFDARTNSVYFMQVDILGLEDVATVERISLDGTEHVSTRTFMGHHDAWLHEDGTLGWLSFDFRTAPVDGSTHDVVGDAIMEIPEGSDDSVTPEVVYAILDKTSPYARCEHFYDELFQTGAYDFSHFNSLVYDANNDHYRALSLYLDSFYTVERASGEVILEVGGDSADVETEDPEDMWSHAHLSHVWDGGFMVFDNGYHHDPKLSRVAEYALDEESGTLELVWEWGEPGNLFNPIFGDAQKLEDTYMTTWTVFGLMAEVDKEGTVVWRAETSTGTAVGRMIWTDDLYDLTDVWSF